jgi:hypothetical protein
MPDLVLDYHRLKTPIDHLDQSVTRAKLEYPTVNVSLRYLNIIGKAVGKPAYYYRPLLGTVDVFTDKAVEAMGYKDHAAVDLRNQNDSNSYRVLLYTGRGTSDFLITRIVAGSDIILAQEAVDLPDGYWHILGSISGSTIKSFRSRNGLPATPNVSATDTALASGYFGVETNVVEYSWVYADAWLRSPSSPSLLAQAILELPIEGSGKAEDPYIPSQSKNLVEIISLTRLPDFLYLEAKKYQMLKNKGFTDEEMQLLLGYIPQHQVDLDSVTWGIFEFYPDKASTVIVTIVGDNPYKSGAIDRQKMKAKRVFPLPKSYDDAVALYNQLKADYPHWIAGVHNWCYQIFGYEIFDLLQNIDFYYGEFLDHKAHYNQLKQVPDWEINNRLSELIDKLSREIALTDERDKHIAKAKEVLKKGW